jgi:GH18 family chitinase
MLREGFDTEAKSSGKSRLLLTAAVAGAKPTIDKAYEVDKVSQHIDWWNLMTYDLHGTIFTINMILFMKF